MTGKLWTLILFLSFLYFIEVEGRGEIHRARPSGVAAAKQTATSTQPALDKTLTNSYNNFETEEETDARDSQSQKYSDIDNEGISSRTEAWVYSIISSILVGLSGIFPLLVIPIEAGPSLKHGAPANRLKLLLSFAVGGLLGDVFLHLLPEAWAHLDKEGHDHDGHIRVGLWVLTGILAFLIIEKAFAEEDEFEHLEDECSEAEEEEKEEQKANEQYAKVTANGIIGKEKRFDLRHRKNGEVIQNGNSSLSTENGHSNGVDKINNAQKSLSLKKKKDSLPEQSHIKVIGWLNLAANVIDNFTHGLAVAGSYLVSPKVGLITTVAILVHEIPHEVGDFAILLRSGFDRWKAAKAQLLTASGGVVGAMTALLAESAETAGNSTAWILPFTSGGFIYIALVTVVPDLLEERHPWESLKQILCLIAGIGAMLTVTLVCE